jgi:Cu+-exporting ATPase
MHVAVSDMHCAACAAAIEERLRHVPGVRSATINLALRSATVAGAPRRGRPGAADGLDDAPAAAAMALSSVSVVENSLRVRVPSGSR